MRVRVSSPRRDRTDHYAESIVKLPVPVNVSVSVNLLARPVLAKQVYERRKRLRLRLHRDSDSDSETGDCELRLASGSFKLAAQITGGRGRPSHWQLSAPGQSRSVLSPGRALTVTEGTHGIMLWAACHESGLAIQALTVISDHAVSVIIRRCRGNSCDIQVATMAY